MIDRRFRLAILAAVTVLVLDQVTKAIVERTMTLYETIPLLPFFSLTYVRNSGAAFGLLGDLSPAVRLPLFVAVTIGAVWALASYLRDVRPEQSWIALALGGILGGAAGNLVCRLRYHEVVDFLHLHYGGYDWPMFNVADSAITVGVALVLLHSLRTPEPRSADGAPATEGR